MPNTTFQKSNRRRQIVIALLIVIVACTLLVYLGAGSASARRLAEAIAEADRLDPGWRLDELDAKRLQAPPPDKNGAAQVQRVAAAMP